MESERSQSVPGSPQSLFREGVCIDPLSSYVLRHYAYFMTTSEHWAMDKLRADWHAMAYGFDSYEIQQLYYRENTVEGHSDQVLKRLYRHRDPTVLRHLVDGVEMFFLRSRQRILREHADEIALMYCPGCASLAISPNDCRCRYCGANWNGPNPDNGDVEFAGSVPRSGQPCDS